MSLNEIIKRVKQKKTLSNLDEKLIRTEIDKILRLNKKTREKIKNSEYKKIEKSKEVKQLIKDTRNELNKIYGIFQTKENTISRNEIENLIDDKTGQGHKKILKKHLSSKERADFYQDFYKKIFDITGNPKSILDLAAGLNPFSIKFMNLEPEIFYYAIELNSWEVFNTQQYFDIMGINGTAIQQDLTKDFSFPKADLVFAFKIFDILEPKYVNKILKNLDCNWIVASFPKMTVKNKPMKFPKRMTFERTLKKCNLNNYEIIEFENEIVYLIKKN